MNVAKKSEPHERRLFDVYLALIGLMTLVLALHNARMQHPWAMGDWLINYQGGFVRRGLAGQIFLLASRHLHVSIFYSIAAIQLACFAAIFWSLRKLVAHSSWPLWSWLILLSPATLAFVLLDPMAAFRKEIALFALLGILIGMLRSPRCKDWWLAVYLGVAFPILFLSHEGLFVYSPYILGAILLALRSIPRLIKICFVPAVLSLVVVYAAATHPGNPIVAAKICASLGDPNASGVPYVCTGAIGFLGVSQAYYKEQVRMLVHDRTMVLSYAITALLSLIPVVMALFAFSRRRELSSQRNIVLTSMLLSFAASVVLFVNAQDWGRWIYAHIVCLMFLLLMVQAQSDAIAPEDSDRPTKSATKTWLASAAIFLYAVSWNLPAVGVTGLSGYFNIARRAAEHLHHG